MKYHFLERSHKNYILHYILFLFVIMLFFIIFSQYVEKHSVSEQCINLTETVRKDIVHCYALEGKYPETIEYLEEHYGLIYDKQSFYIDYLPIGENIMPDFTVISIGR